MYHNDDNSYSILLKAHFHASLNRLTSNITFSYCSALKGLYNPLCCKFTLRSLLIQMHELKIHNVILQNRFVLVRNTCFVQRIDWARSIQPKMCFRMWITLIGSSSVWWGLFLRWNVVLWSMQWYGIFLYHTLLQKMCKFQATAIHP